MENTLNHCYLYEIKKRDGRCFRFTNHDDMIVLWGEKFHPAAIEAHSQLEENLGLTADNLSLSLSISHEMIEEQALENGEFFGANLKIWLFDWKALRRLETIFDGQISHLHFSKLHAEANFLSFEDKLSRPSNREFRHSCSARLGDEACRVNLDDYRIMVNIVKSHNDWLGFVNPYEHHPRFTPNVLKNGLVRIRSDAAQTPNWQAFILDDRIEEGLRYVQLSQRPNFPLALSQEIELVMGCDLSLSCCANRFDNARNFAGFPFIPSDDWLKLTPNNAPLNGQSYLVHNQNSEEL